jgi:hypothetical protein
MQAVTPVILNESQNMPMNHTDNFIPTTAMSIWSPRIAEEEKLAPHVRSAAPDDRWAPEIFDDANQQQ